MCRRVLVNFKALSIDCLKSTVSWQGNTCLSVLLYWDIKNAFNAVNHGVIFIVLEAKGFPAADIDLISGLYYWFLLSIGNLEPLRGDSCMLLSTVVCARHPS